ncbi:MAG: MBL fold metallo-hydrolase [Bacillota bacterium]|nr:MBL fold metallo-hydrolase [Bacillota bacterium]
MRNKIAAFTLSIMMVFTMTPVLAFAEAEESTEATPVEAETESVQVEEPQASEEPAVPDDYERLEEASAGLVGEPTLEDPSKLENSMRIYAIYLHRADGSMVAADRYGDAVLIESNGRYLLMDTGTYSPVKDSDAVHTSNLVETLHSIMGENKQLEVYISHLHGDHIRGLQGVCDAFDVTKVYLPDMELCKDYYLPGETGKKIELLYEKHLKIIEKENAELVYLAPSCRAEHAAAKTYDEFTVGAVNCKVIGPVGVYTVNQFKSQDGKCGTKQGHYLNNCSLCTMMTCGNFRYLTAGDIESQEETNLVNKYGTGLNADVMKISHHALYTSNTAGFLNKVTPMWSFEEDHGYSGSSTSGSITRAKGMGYNYGVASSKGNFIIDVNDNKVQIYRDTNRDGQINEDPLKGWVSTGKGYQYYNSSGNICTGWQWIGGYAYYMNSNSGFRYTGRHKISGTKVKFSSTGKLTSHKKPTKVRMRSAKANAGQTITIKWRKASRASRYQIYRYDSVSGAYTYVCTLSKGRRSYTDTGLEPGLKYSYKVRAIRYVAGGTIYGSFSKVKSAVAK